MMGKPEGQLFSSHISGEMNLGKCKFSVGDVIRALSSSRVLKKVIFLEPMRFGPQNFGSPSEIYPPFD